MGLTIEPLLDSEEADYLAHLNECFSGWGDQSFFEWVFHRDSGAGPADLLYARSEGQVIGGTGVTYRRVMHTGGRESKIGIMTGSWVLPEARGKGCFTRLIDAMSASAAQRDCSLLVAFGFESNPSFHAMKRAGLALIDSSYLRDPAAVPCENGAAPLATLSVGDRSELFSNANSATADVDRVRYVYTPEAWRDQFLHGAHPKAFLELPGESVALVEEANGFLRLQALAVKRRSVYPEVLQTLFDLAKSRGHRLFLYSMDDELTDAATAIGCERIAGGYFLKIANPKALAKWVGCHDSDVSVESCLLDRRHPAYLGAWEIQNGDRM